MREKQLTLGIEQPRDAVLLLHRVERGLEPIARPGRSCLSPVKQIGPVAMDERRKGESVAPRAGEVVDAHARIARGGATRPAQQRLASGQVLLADDDVGDLAKSEANVCVCGLENHDKFNGLAMYYAKPLFMNQIDAAREREEISVITAL